MFMLPYYEYKSIINQYKVSLTYNYYAPEIRGYLYPIIQVIRISFPPREGKDIERKRVLERMMNRGVKRK